MPFSLEYDLSEELLDHIISASSRASLASLCLTSKKLSRIATPYLYSDIFFSHGDSDSGIKHILPFTYLIFTSPSHASLVHSLAIRETWANNETEEVRDNVDPEAEDFKFPWPKYGTPELEGVLRRKCVEYAIDDQEAREIYEKIKSGANENVLLTLLLANLTNLQKLDLNIGILTDRDDLVAMLERIGNRIKPFDKLPSVLSTNDKPKSSSSMAFSKPLDVCITGDDDKYPHDPIYFAAFFNLPNLRSIYGYKMGDSEGEPETNSVFTRLKPRSCPVQYIECRTSKFHSNHLRAMMAATIPGKLKTFNYEIGCTWAWCTVDHNEIIKSLEAHHDTLECLGLSHEDFYPYQFNNDADRPDPVSFVPFKMLKKLKVAPVYIWGQDVFVGETQLKKNATRQMLWKALPGSLEELWITRAQAQVEGENKHNRVVRFIPDCLIPALELAVQYKYEFYPRLSSLRIEFPLGEWEDDWVDLLASFCNKAEASGVRCTVIITKEMDYRGYDDKPIPEKLWGWDEDVEWRECIENHEPPKTWIEISEEPDLPTRLRKMKKLCQEENLKVNEEMEMEEKKIEG